MTGLAQRTQRVAADLAHACEKVGFFYALNHGAPDDTIEQAFAASRRFHALPLEQKLALRLDDNNIGYLPIDASIQGASAVHKAIRPNQNESFFVTHDRAPDHPDTIAGKPLRGRNQWPPGLPGLRADMMAYFDAWRAMCDRMLPPFVMALAPRSFPGPSDQPRQHHEALVERPLPVDTARRHQQIRHRPLFNRLFPQSHPGRGHRVRSHLHRRRQSAPLPGGYLPRPCSRILPGELVSPEGSPLGGGGERCRICWSVFSFSSRAASLAAT